MSSKGSAFAGLFDNRLDEMPNAAERNEAKPAPSEPPPVKVSGRRQGKRSHPDFKQYSVLLKKQTHKDVGRMLDDQESGKDVSELVQELLESWLRRQLKKA